MSEVTAILTMLVRLGFSTEAAAYMVGTLGIDSLTEIAIYYGDDNVEKI